MTDVTLREYFEALREADLRALTLAREIQDYKDERANDLRSQIESERGNYVTVDKFDAALAPLLQYIAAQQGRQEGIHLSGGVIVAGLAAAVSAISIVIVIANLLTA